MFRFELPVTLMVHACNEFVLKNNNNKPTLKPLHICVTTSMLCISAGEFADLGPVY